MVIGFLGDSRRFPKAELRKQAFVLIIIIRPTYVYVVAGDNYIFEDRWNSVSDVMIIFRKLGGSLSRARELVRSDIAARLFARAYSSIRSKRHNLQWIRGRWEPSEFSFQKVLSVLSLFLSLCGSLKPGNATRLNRRWKMRARLRRSRV